MREQRQEQEIQEGQEARGLLPTLFDDLGDRLEIRKNNGCLLNLLFWFLECYLGSPELLRPALRMIEGTRGIIRARAKTGTGDSGGQETRGCFLRFVMGAGQVGDPVLRSWPSDDRRRRSGRQDPGGPRR